MKVLSKTWILIGCTFFLTYCTNNTNSKVKSSMRWKKHFLYPKHSMGFQIFETNDSILLITRNPADTSIILSTHKFKKNNSCKNQSLCITSTTHAVLFHALNANSLIKGCAGQKYIQDSVLKNFYLINNIPDIGADDKLNREKIVSLNPNYIMVYPFEGNDYSVFEKAKIPLIYNCDYLEDKPLARAEYIKMAGILSGKYKECDSIFNFIESKYQILKTNNKNKHYRKNVILGKPYDNIWYIPAKNSYAAQFIYDAGAKYIYNDIGKNNVESMPFEKVLMNANKIDVWLFTESCDCELAYEKLVQENKLFGQIKAFSKKNVYACNTLKADYFGIGILEPHIILQDITNILNNSLINQNIYFKPLQ